MLLITLVLKRYAVLRFSRFQKALGARIGDVIRVSAIECMPRGKVKKGEVQFAVVEEQKANLIVQMTLVFF